MKLPVRRPLLRRLCPLLFLAAAVALDQWTKALAVTLLQPIPTYPLWEDVLHFTYRTNTGAAFSIFSAPDQRWIYLTISAIAIVVGLVYLLWRWQDNAVLRYAVAAVTGGGIGNMIDRLGRGYVVDFIDVRLIHFAVFNVADCFVCVGTFLLAAAILYGEFHRPAAPDGDTAV